MTTIDKYGRAFTQDKFIADKYKVLDQRIDFNAIKKWEPQVDRYSKLTTWDKWEKKWRLPPSVWASHKWDSKNIDLVWELSLYWYQKDSVFYIDDCYKQWKKSAFIVSGTATGKSHIILWTIYLFRQRTVIVVPNLSIWKWLYDKIQKYTSSCGFLTAEKVRKANDKKCLPDILILHWLSFNNVYEIINGYYQVMICDEWHHLPNTRRDQYNKWKGMFCLWVTATPQKKEYWIEWFHMFFWNVYDTEKQALDVEIFFYEYKYDYSIEEVMSAREWLAPDSPELSRRLYCSNSNRVEHLVKCIKQLKSKWLNKFMIFTDRKEHIKLIQSIIPNTIKITGDISKLEREKIMDDLWEKEEYIIVAIDKCVWEWFDLPPLECGILFMSTGWINTIDQTVWRQRRYYWDKKRAYYLDFIDKYSIMWWREKTSWWYERLRIYKNKKRTVKPLFDTEF